MTTSVKIFTISSAVAASSGRFSVLTKSCRRSATTQPKALVIPGRAGIRTRGTANSHAKAVAWSGPAPPKANSAKSRGSAPIEMDTIRIAPAICVLAIRTTASASSVMPAEPSAQCRQSTASDKSAPMGQLTSLFP